jgi:hypothetical protein
MTTALLSGIGQVEWVPGEEFIDAVTAVSGSGPAYVFFLVECLTEAGIAAGLPADVAARLARGTIEGAGELLHRSPLDPAILRQNVTSPKGTTYAALQVLMAEDGMQPLFDKAIEEATKRVCDTSLPFFMAGAGAYFATNTYNESFLDDLLKGKTISTCFRVFSEPQFEIYMTETITSKNALNLKTISISGYQDPNKPKAQYYHTAFVGPENFTIKSIIQTSK